MYISTLEKGSILFMLCINQQVAEKLFPIFHSVFITKLYYSFVADFIQDSRVINNLFQALLYFLTNSLRGFVAPVKA